MCFTKKKSIYLQSAKKDGILYFNVPSKHENSTNILFDNLEISNEFENLRTFSDLGGDKFRLFISKMYLKFRKETTELINIWIPIIDKKKF